MDIEKFISPLIQSQFPKFYQEEGENFITFVKAYYEWMEEQGNPIHEARNLLEYRDIDTTLEDFILYFKEKYLKNIQFDTSTNKTLLVKNSLELYRSKGTERSIDLFFKLVYGTSAEVRYPAEKIFRLSDGIWTKPVYIEITNNKYNIDYVGKQIIGSVSGATAFVESFIKRRVESGYVSILYVSNINGTFRRGEVIGIMSNGVGQYEKAKRAKLVGSVTRVFIENGGSEFEVGDLVHFTDSFRGKGATARVTQISDVTGIVDFMLVDGGWGYSTNADIIVSEKVLGASQIVANTTSDQYYSIFERLYQPMANVSFNSATTDFSADTIVYRYNTLGQLVSSAKILSVTQTGGSNTGTMLLSCLGGPISNSTTYRTAANAQSFYVTDVTDKTISATVMGIPTRYDINNVNRVGTVNVGDTVYQKDTNGVFGSGVVSAISGNTISISSAKGVFKDNVILTEALVPDVVGTITTSTSSNAVTGSGTSFNGDLVGAFVYVASNNAYIGTVSEVTDNTNLKLGQLAGFSVSANNYRIKLPYYLRSEESNTFTANVVSVSGYVGVNEINKTAVRVAYFVANNLTIAESPYVYQYSPSGYISAKAKVITSSYSSGSGNLYVMPMKGSFAEAEAIYTEGNTARAIVQTYETTVSGGDLFSEANTLILALSSDASFQMTSASYGSGASANVGTIEETESVFINTDKIADVSTSHINLDRKELTLNTTTNGFDVGSYVYQYVSQVSFNPSTAVDPSTGFITLSSGANTYFLPGDFVKYRTATGNTVINGMSNNDTFYVYASNTTGVTLAVTDNKSVVLSNSAYTTFANNVLNETGHFLYKEAMGTVVNMTSTKLRLKDVHNSFGNTGGSPYSNGNIISSSNSSANDSCVLVAEYNNVLAANQIYYTMPLRIDGYGFPKKPSGELTDTMVSLLSFSEFTVGTIATLSGINPGEDYNIDPYILAHQPYVSAYNKKDFVVEVSSGATGFSVGEKITQSPSSLTQYDLRVDSGVYSNSFSTQEVSVTLAYEVNTTSNFILAPYELLSFNSNTDVVSANDTIAIPLTNNSYVRYYTSPGNTALTGLSNNGFYYVVSADGDTIKLSATEGGAAIDITGAATGETGHFILRYANPFSNGAQVLYTTYTGNTAIGGLSNNQLYYAVYANSIGFALSATYGGANVNLT